MKKIISILVLLCMAVSAFAVSPVIASAETGEAWGGDYDTSFFTDGSGDGSEGNPFKISTPEHWYAFVKWSNKELTVDGVKLDDWYYFELTADLKFNEGYAAEWAAGTSTPKNTKLEPAYDEVKSGKWGVKFNGNGHTISGVYMNTGAVIGLFGNPWGNDDTHNDDTYSVIENLIVENSYFYGSDGWVGSVIAETSGRTKVQNIYVKENVYVYSGGNVAGGIIGGAYHTGPYTVTVNDCIFAGTVSSTGSSNGGIIGSGNSSNKKLHHIVINNCLVTGSVSGTETSNGFVGSNSNSASTTITNSIYAGKGFTNYPFAIGTANGSTVTVSNCYTTQMGTDDNAYITKGNTGSVDGVEVVSVDQLMGKGAIDIDGFIKVDGGIMIPEGVAASNASLRGEGTEESPYLIANADEWTEFRLFSIRNDLSDKYVKLEADIDFEGTKIAPVEGFCGTLDGNGKTLKNITMTGSGDVALFCELGDGATIKNFVIKSSTFTIEGDGNWMGTVACCTNGKNVTISGIYVDKDVKLVAGKKDGNSLAGGILGGVYGMVQSSVVIEDCVFAGSIEAKGDNVAGILASVEQKKAYDGEVEFNTVTVRNCLNLGTVKSEGSYVAGIAVGQGMTVEGCINLGTVIGGETEDSLVAGIAAVNPYADVIVKNCYSTSNIVSRKAEEVTEGEVTEGEVTEGEESAKLGSVIEENNVANVELMALVGRDAIVGLEGWSIRTFDVVIPTAIESFAPAWRVPDQVYTVTWKNGDEVLASGQYEFGETPEYEGETPTFSGSALYIYEFAGWDPQISAVTADIVYNARFNKIKKDLTAITESDADIVIRSADDWMTYLSGKTVTDKVVVVVATELDFKGMTVEPVKEFSGFFGGNGVVIKNLKIVGNESTGGEAGLFGCLAGESVFRDFLITDSTFEAEQWVGAIACCTKGNIEVENVYISKTVKINAGDKGTNNSYAGGLFGGFAGEVTKCVIKDCVFAGTITAKGKYNGGLVGAMFNCPDLTIENSMVLGKIVNDTTNDDNKNYSCGFVGSAKDKKITLTNCIYAGGQEDEAYYNRPFFYEAKEATVINCYTIATNSTGKVYNNVKDTDANSGVKKVDFAKDLVLSDTSWNIEGFVKRNDDVMVPAGVAAFAPKWVEDSYTVVWMNGSIVLKTQEYKFGDMPTYDGETPTIAENAVYRFEFKGWSPQISPVYGDVTYTAQFETIEKEIVEDEPESEPESETESETQAETESETEEAPVVEEKSFFGKIFDAIFNFFKNIFAAIFGKED